jgi:hypothetical protein
LINVIGGTGQSKEDIRNDMASDPEIEESRMPSQSEQLRDPRLCELA